MATLELVYLGGRRKTMKLYRCTEDFNLLTEKKIAEGQCAGHHIKEIVRLTTWEKILLTLGLIS